MKNAVAIILAGGSGTRFWPLSTQDKPKQFCKIGHFDQTLLELTLARLDGWIPPERRMIVTSEALIETTRECVGSQVARFIAEPEQKNTANALYLAAKVALDLDPQAVILSFHADHLIQDVQNFKISCSIAYEHARKGKTVLLGIKPKSPETGYGYIETAESVGSEQGITTFGVSSFKEKPDIATAREYLLSGNYLWNSGLFAWSSAKYLELYAKFLPQNSLAMDAVTVDDILRGRFAKVFAGLESISVDHGILEKADQIVAVACSFDWFDVGSWSALRECFDTDESGNYLEGNIEILNVDNSTLVNRSQGQLLTAIGVKDIAVVLTPKAVMVCSHEKAQQLSAFVRLLREKQLNDFL